MYKRRMAVSNNLMMWTRNRDNVVLNKKVFTIFADIKKKHYLCLHT